MQAPYSPPLEKPIVSYRGLEVSWGQQEVAVSSGEAFFLFPWSMVYQNDVPLRIKVKPDWDGKVIRVLLVMDSAANTVRIRVDDSGIDRVLEKTSTRCEVLLGAKEFYLPRGWFIN